uniref:Uncharacterized protein n=1 Tax=Corvus moneduloides TaxID=1196302 RepID=A0A8C3ESN5_CORMO
EFFSAEDYSCGGLLSSSSGTLQSPFYPGNYPNNANCVWEIQLCLFPRMEGGRCLSDYVEIYDGPLHTSPLLGKICSGYYHTYTSSSNLLIPGLDSDLLLPHQLLLQKTLFVESITYNLFWSLH